MCSAQLYVVYKLPVCITYIYTEVNSNYYFIVYWTPVESHHTIAKYLFIFFFFFVGGCCFIYHWRRKRGGGGEVGHVPPHFFNWGQWYVCVPPPPPHTLLTPHLYFPLELYVYITLTNNYLTFFIYQLIILWTISINWHRWMLVNNHVSKYNLFILVLYRWYINYMSVCPPHFLAPSYATVYIYIYIYTHTHTCVYVS